MKSPDQKKTYYTTHEAARILGVTPITVIRWVQAGRLTCFTTVGGHRRIKEEELMKFAQDHHIPWLPAKMQNPHHELTAWMMAGNNGLSLKINDFARQMEGFRFVTVPDAFSAGLLWHEGEPDLVILDFASSPEEEALGLCRTLKSRKADLAFIGLVNSQDPDFFSRLRAEGVGVLVSYPFTEESLLSSFQAVRERFNQRHAA